MWFNRKLIFCTIKNKLNLSINAQTRACLILHNYIIENGSVGLKKKKKHEPIKLYTKEKCVPFEFYYTLLI